MMMVDDRVLKMLKRDVKELKDDVEEIGVVEDSIDNDDVLNRLGRIELLVNELIVDSFMGDDDE
jgi:hypothetical protein